MSMYTQFATDKALEKNGVTVNYGSFRVVLARMGGHNDKFRTELEKATRPHRRAIQMNVMDANLLVDIMRDVFVRTCIRGWSVTKMIDGDGNAVWQDGVEMPDGSIAEPTAENISKALKSLPDLLDDLQSQASSITLYRQEMLEEDAGN